MNVELCQSAALWNDYVDGMADAFNYHRWVWKTAIEQTFGHRAYYLAATDAGAIQGVLPLFRIHSRLFGDSLVSVPFFSYGGPLASNRAALDALLSRTADLARDLGVRHVELRQGGASTSYWHQTSLKVAMGVPLPATADQLWNSLSSRLRNKVRTARKHGFRVQWGGAEDIPAFYQVFAGNMRNLGTPVYPRSWFENLCRVESDGIQIITLWDDGKPLAAAFLSGYRGTMEAPWIASLPEGRKKYSSVLLYWSFLERAIEQGFREFDLGRCTPGGGTYEFKRLWPCVEKPLHVYYWVAAGENIPELRKENRKMRLAIEMWKRLPLFVANQLGPRIVRSLP